MIGHFLSSADLDAITQAAILDEAARWKDGRKSARPLEGKSIAMMFEKPSTRTRISFEVGIADLGAHPLSLSSSELQLGRGETIEDTARVLSRYVHGVVLRTFGHDRLERLAAASSIPVVNALSDREHPCQALADLLTLRERFGDLAGRTLAYTGDGNNVAHSLLLAGSLAGMTVVVATPPGYEPDPSIVEQAASLGGSVRITNDPQDGVKGADAIYTDVWASMGQEDEADARATIFAPYRVDEELLSAAHPDAIVLHCLPAHRGDEITDAVIDGPRSAVWDQAENRLHVQKAVLRWLLA